MSQAILHRGRRPRRTKVVYDFTPGRLERLHLSLHKIPGGEGAIKVRLVGQAYVACGVGNEHYPELDVHLVVIPANKGHLLAGTLAAYDGDVDAATELALELEGHGLEFWFDPCEAEGIE